MCVYKRPFFHEVKGLWLALGKYIFLIFNFQEDIKYKIEIMNLRAILDFLVKLKIRSTRRNVWGVIKATYTKNAGKNIKSRKAPTLQQKRANFETVSNSTYIAINKTVFTTCKHFFIS